MRTPAPRVTRPPASVALEGNEDGARSETEADAGPGANDAGSEGAALQARAAAAKAADHERARQDELAEASRLLSSAYSDATQRSMANVDEALLNYELIEMLIGAIARAEREGGEGALVARFADGAIPTRSDTSPGAVLVFLPGQMEITRLIRDCERSRHLREEDVGAPKVRGRRPTKVVAAGRLKGNIEFDGLKPKPEYHQLGDIVEKLPKTTYLAVQVNHAFGLMPADASGTSDPFVVVQWDGREQSTQVKYRTLSPKWGQTLYFPLKVMAVTKELLEKAMANSKVQPHVLEFIEATDKAKYVLDLFDKVVVNNPDFPPRTDVSYLLRETIAKGVRRWPAH